MQCRSLNLGVSSLVEHLAQCAHYGGTLEECILNAVVHDKVNVALTETQLGVVKLVVSHSVLILYDWQRLQALRKQGERLCVYRYFAGLCTEHIALDTDKVAYVHQTLEHSSVQSLVLIGADIVACDVHLDAAL